MISHVVNCPTRQSLLLLIGSLHWFLYPDNKLCAILYVVFWYRTELLIVPKTKFRWKLLSPNDMEINQATICQICPIIWKKHKREVAEDLTRVSLRVSAFVYRFPAWHLLGVGRRNLTTTFATMMDEQFYLLTIFFTPNRRNRTPFKVFKVCDNVFNCAMSEDGTGGDSIAASIFVWHWLSWQIVLDSKIQITLLILRRGVLSRHWERKKIHMYGEGDVIGRSTRARVIDYLDV